MKTKKMIILLIAVALTAGIFAGCGGSQVELKGEWVCYQGWDNIRDNLYSGGRAIFPSKDTKTFDKIFQMSIASSNTVYLQFNDTGHAKCSLSIKDDTITLSYKEIEILNAGYTFENNVLTIQAPNGNIIFKRFDAERNFALPVVVSENLDMTLERYFINTDFEDNGKGKIGIGVIGKNVVLQNIHDGSYSVSLICTYEANGNIYEIESFSYHSILKFAIYVFDSDVYPDKITFYSAYDDINFEVTFKVADEPQNKYFS
ncbi:MAG: hypothetical protein LBI19_04095 [Oscillospiraceae bacterium]|jgi:hypothetical protein|nr:hypothetical protein [Oscillospiraceae bacterium]